jgi:hypothetical protein
MFDMTDSEESLIWITSRTSLANGDFFVSSKMSFDQILARCQQSSSVKERAAAMGVRVEWR